MSMKVFSETLNLAWKNYECGWHHPLNEGPMTEQREEKKLNTRTCPLMLP